MAAPGRRPRRGGLARPARPRLRRRPGRRGPLAGAAQPRLLVDAPVASAEIYLHGAHLTSWVPRGGTEVIFTSAQAIFDGAKAIRGGIPLCLPWFGAGPDGDQKPAHGWGRTSTWELDDRSEERRVGKECRSRWSPYH